MKVKVCGMREPQNVKELSQLPINYMGLIFYPKSKRAVAAKVLPDTPSHIERVGVFVNASSAEVAALVQQHRLDVVQLHGHESPGYCQELAQQTTAQVWKAFSVGESFDFAQCASYQASCSMFVFDTKGVHPGGNGVKFNWSLLESYTLDTPFLLSGGIAPEDAEAVKKFTHPKFAGVDINSGFEIEPAKKNIDMVKEFVTDIQKQTPESYHVDAEGYYGKFGGAFVPEMLRKNIETLQERYLEIIESESFQKKFKELQQHYIGRPSPLYHAKRLSEKYQTQIYLKREDLNHTGSHKINNTIGQILLAKELGKTRIIAETGAGQHGVATATVCALMDIQCVVYMGAIDIERQAPNVARMKLLGAEVVPATTGSKTLKDATNEAIRDWINNPEDTFYIIGSVVGFHPYPDMVARFQSVISKEIQQQVPKQTAAPKPNYVVACVGGGSNSMGSFYHFLDDLEVKLIAAEAAGLGVDTGKTAASISKGTEGVIHGSKTMMIQTQDGQIVEPYSISAGLDYPGIGPALAHLWKTERAQFCAVTDQEALDASMELCRLEGIIPAIESAHALAVLPKCTFSKEDVVVITVSGRGDKDMETFMKRFNL